MSNLDTNKIQKLILESVQGITGLPRIVLPNTSYTPKIGTPFITVGFTMGEPSMRTVSGISQTVTGTFNFNCFHPANTGYNPVADNIIKHFQNTDNMNLDYDTNFKLWIMSAWRGNDLVDDQKTWNRNTAVLRFRLTISIT